jgi:serine/threonine protein kinase/tetratricopeptide (TPR) repeat protein
VPLSPGDPFDRYLVETLLGKGGMGEVWRAVDPKLDRRIALKILSKTDPFDPRGGEARSRLLREARAAAALDHPNVVAVFDVGEVGETPYIAMELVEGVTLREFVGDARVSARRRMTWMLEIGRALAAAHKRGIVHRDVKPENVMVRGDGAIKVLDFGIARRVRVSPTEASAHAASVVTRDGEPVGTLMYMAPEQLEGGWIDARCDQFAWGIVALEIFRGAHPWGSPTLTPVSLVDAILHGEAAPIEGNGDVPEGFARAVVRAIAKKPEDRFASMDELLATLDEERLPTLRPRATAPMAFASTSGPLTLGESPRSRPPFVPGAVVAERYEVVSFLGRGAMGEVYEARNRETGLHVALKMVRADRTGERQVLARFKREVELAQRVNHPNVVRVLDVRTHFEGADREPSLVLAMELLRGDSLAEHLRRRGAMSDTEARPLAEQMGRALGAAHSAGIVHRDFKSDNVFLERAGRKVRAVVTDFGLSRAMSPDLASDPTLSRDVALLGTPAYMAPEQITGGHVDARADIYAFGVVLFELVTGRLPFAGDTPLETAMMRLSQRPPSPRALVPALDPSWDAAIMRCLAREPHDRFTTTADVLDALAVVGVRRPKRTWAFVAGALGVTALSAALLIHRAHSQPAATATTNDALDGGAPIAPPRSSVAVWPLHNASGDPHAAWLGAALGEMLRTELSAGEALRVVPGASVARVQRDLALAETADLSQADVLRAASPLGATFLVDGAFLALGTDGHRRVRVDLHAKDAKSGGALAAVAESGAEDELFELVQRAAASLRRELHAPTAGAASERMARAALPKSADAARAYAEGTAAMQALDYNKAREHFERAVALDPEAPLPRASLSSVLLTVGFVSRAAEEAKAALDRSSGVSREDRLVIEAQYQRSIYDQAGCADRWHVLAGFFPDNVEYGIELARAYLRAGEPARAREAIVALRTLPPPVDADPRLDLLEANAVGGSDFKAQGTLAEAALAKAHATGSRSLAVEAEEALANARGNLGHDLSTLPDEFRRIEREYLDLGNPRAAALAGMTVIVAYDRLNDWNAAEREAVRTLETAKSLGYPDLEAKAEFRYAQVLRHKAPDQALPRLARALEIARYAGDRATEERVLNQQGILYWGNNQYVEARPLLEEAAKIAGAIGAKSEETDALDNLGLVLENLGEPREALTVHERMAARYAEAGNTREQFLTLVNEAVVLISLGDPSAAMTRLDDADHLGGGGPEYELAAKGTRGRVQALRGDLEAAHVTIQSVIDELKKKGAADDADGWEQVLLELDVTNGVPRTAELQRVMATDKDRAGDAGEVANLAMSLALDGNLGAATASARRALALSKDAQAFVKRTEARLRAAEVLAWAGHRSEARAIAEPLIAEAEPRGLVPTVLLARRVAATALDPKADAEARNAQLAAVARDAREHGLVGLARAAEREQSAAADK